MLDLSTVGVTRIRGQESQILVLGGVRPKQGAPKMKRPERRVLFHRTQPRLKLLQEGFCNLQGAGGRARSPTPWGGTSQETPYLAYGPELGIPRRRRTNEMSN